MITKDFYNIIDGELDELLEKYAEDDYLKKHKGSINNQKSYALLIWFLEFYGKIANYTPFITEGKDDSSCDIVFDKNDKHNNKIFYIVQSKWNTAKNSGKESDKDEILKALSDFQTILRGGKKKVNKKLASKLEELDKHLKANGTVKFIFLSLSQYKGNADDNIQSFIDKDDKIKCEVIDINRIREDYIDRKYKKIDPINPLENYLNPEESPITLEIERLEDKSGNYIKIEKPFEAYVFLLRPKMIFDLFDKYGFALFFKNVRNPLLKSQFNADIEQTAKENPAYFWYYNNGITAITYLLPSIGKRAVKIKLTGLQIINGAQTVYSIYSAYKNASRTKRTQMNREALITLRLLKSGGKDFDLNVTRYTNSQNPIQDRDFYANEDIQVELQKASYLTKVWYEKRRDEFREVPEGIVKVSNSLLAEIYLAYQLQDPVSVVIKIHTNEQNFKKNLSFISRREHQDGLYEKIFNKNTSYEDMLCSFYIFSIMRDFLLQYDTHTPMIYHFLALFKIAFTKYLKTKFNNEVNINKYVLKIVEKGETEIILKTTKFLIRFVAKHINIAADKKETNISMDPLLSISGFEKIKDTLEELPITIKDIEDITLEEGEI